ncbi:TRAPP II complex [Dipodascopsis uninucleata]
MSSKYNSQQLQQLDSFSYAAPSRIRVFLVPVGSISRERFSNFVDRLQSTSVIRLGDLTPDVRPERVMFSPQGFPDGLVVYNFCTSVDTTHKYLEDLELHRRNMAVFGLVDYTNVKAITDLLESLATLRVQHPEAVIHKLLLFDSTLEANEMPSIDFVAVPPKRVSRVTSMRTILCDLTTSLLAELPLLAHAFQAADTIASPHARDDDYDSVMLYSSSVTYPQGSSAASSTGSLSSTGRDNRSSITYPLSHHTERQRIKRKGRAMKTVAQMYLLAGRTPDAMKEYVEALNVLKGVNDHLWHASCLEGIGICMLILSYLNVPFTIPSVVLPPVSNSSTTASFKSKSSNKEEQRQPPHLLELLPQMTSTIIGLYNRSQVFPGESLPQIAYAETILRTVNLLTCMCLAGGWTPDGKAAAVLSRPFPDDVLKSLSFSTAYASKMAIMNWISAAQAVRLDGLDALDASRILIGIATACGKLGFLRKRALVLRQLIDELIPRIIQVRMLSRSGRPPTVDSDGTENDEDELLYDRDPMIKNHDSDSTILAILHDVCTNYGVPMGDFNSSALPDSNPYGWQDLKTSLLKTCIKLCQVLPDYVGIVKYVNLLFRLSSADLQPQEQISLIQSMRDAYSVVRSVGIKDFEDEYWDLNFIRDASVVQSSLWTTPKLIPIPQKLLSTEAIIDESAGPFIYNPFANKDDKGELKQIFVLGEPVEFRVLLQNIFAFDLEVKAVSLVGEGASFVSDVVSTVMPPRKLSPVSIYLTPTSVGVFKVTGCRFQVYGCKETYRSIEPIKLAAASPPRIKEFGLQHLNKDRVFESKGIEVTKRSSLIEREKTLNIKVIPSLPFLRINSMSLYQNSMMLLEGERRQFKIVVGNVSESVTANYLALKFKDSTTDSLMNALQSGTQISSGTKQYLSASEIYEIEVFLYKRSALQWVHDDEEDEIEISPNGERDIVVEVVGKRGLTSATIDIEYSHISPESLSLAKRNLYARTVTVDLNLTVNASIEIAGCDFVPFSFDMPISVNDNGISASPRLQQFLDEVGIKLEDVNDMDSFCLMLLDLRNSWPSALEVEIFTDLGDTEHRVFSTIQPGHTNRLLVPIRRIRDIDSRKPIPRLNAPKQYVVPNSGQTPDSMTGSNKNGLGSMALSAQVEKAVFWYREELLRVLRGSWKEVHGAIDYIGVGDTSDTSKSHRTGSIELRALRITPQMVDIMRIDDVVLDLYFRPSPDIKSLGRKHWLVQPDCFITLVVAITSNYKMGESVMNEVSGILRMQPALRNLPATAALDINRRIIFNGVLQKPVVSVKSGETREIELDIVVLAKGEYEVVASFEETKGADQGRHFVGREKLVFSVC